MTARQYRKRPVVSEWPIPISWPAFVLPICKRCGGVAKQLWGDVHQCPKCKATTMYVEYKGFPAIDINAEPVQ